MKAGRRPKQIAMAAMGMIVNRIGQGAVASEEDGSSEAEWDGDVWRGRGYEACSTCERHQRVGPSVLTDAMRLYYSTFVRLVLDHFVKERVKRN
jgi:hypothetical protein